jgi:glutathione S-transferase
MFQMGLGPMQGQANVSSARPEKISHAIDRHQKETAPHTVLDRRLADHEHLAGDYSIADIATWPWDSLRGWAGVDVDDLPHLQRWIDKVGSRPAVVKGREIPEVLKFEHSPEDIVKAGAKILV